MKMFRLCQNFKQSFKSISGILLPRYMSSAPCPDIYDKIEHHVPVMVSEVLSMLDPKENEIILDMTFGAGGHTKAILEMCPSVTVYALDRDPGAIALAQKLLKQYPNRLVPLLGRFTELPKLLHSKCVDLNSIDSVLFDLGSSSMQLNRPESGFAFTHEGPLDMRMDGDRDPNVLTAADVINHADEYVLAKIFKSYGQEKKSKKMARIIVEARHMLKDIKTTKELADIIQGSSEGVLQFDKLGRVMHPATRIFQALRVFVNNELNELNFGLEVVHRYLKLDGKLVTLTFHSLEDRIVKRHLTGMDLEEPLVTGIGKKLANYSLYAEGYLESPIHRPWKPINKHVFLPTEEELSQNPRARSAKLRAALKC